MRNPPSRRQNPPRPPAVERLAGWSARHRRTAVIGWLLLIAAAIAVGQLVGTGNKPSFNPGEAGRAERILHDAGVSEPVTETVLVQARSDPAPIDRQPRAVAAIRSVVEALSAMPGSVQAVRSPLDVANRAQLSADGRTAIVTFTLGGPPDRASSTVRAPLAAVAQVQSRYPDLRIAEAGPSSVNAAINDVVGRDFRRAELTSVPITLAILLLVFGALVAAGIPVLLAGTAVAAAIGLLAVPSHWFPIDATTSSLILLVGMAVGVDYSLFYLRREREEREAGHGLPAALRIAAATSGRAIVVSGGTVMVCLAGLFLTGVDVFTGMAFGTIAVVGIAVAGSVTVLPALLAWLGPRVERGRLPWRRLVARPDSDRRGGAESRVWSALVRRVVRHPVLLGGAAALVLVGLAIPALGLRIGSGGLSELPADQPTVAAMRQVQALFPGGGEQETVVVTGRGLDRPQVRAAVAALRARVAGSGGLLGPDVSSASAQDGRVLLLRVPVNGDEGGSRSERALTLLRAQLPGTLGQVGGLSYAVAGPTAGAHDFSAALRWRSPLAVLFVLALAFGLQMLMFRSLAIPLTGIVLTSLSVGAAYGVVVWVFQNGHLESLLGFHSYGAITPWMPLFMFVLLFGLSMDYHVFIVSRIRELHAAGAGTREAIVRGISTSAGVVTSAAAIMVAVFSVFAMLTLLPMKIFGVGMAVAVLLDATLVRGLLLPAAMTLLGERNWSQPRGLAWLDRGRLADGDRMSGQGRPADVRLPAPVPVPAPEPAYQRVTGPGSSS